MNKTKTIYATGIFLIVILTVAVTVLSILLLKNDKKEELSDMEKYYNAKCESYKTQNFNLSKGQIVFVGDSITDLCPLDDYYSDLPLATYNRGIGGDRTEGVLRRLDCSIFDIEPSCVVLLIGTNDINFGVENEKTIENYEKIINTIKEKLPNTKLYCVSIIPQGRLIEGTIPTTLAENTETIMKINSQIKSLCEKEQKACYVDIFSSLADENNILIDTYTDDGLHLNANGFALWSEIMLPLLKETK